MFLDILIANMHQAIFRYPDVLRYLQSRNISEDEVRTYSIGYSNLVGVPDENSTDRQRFMDECYRGRKIERKVIFPLKDEIGRVVGLTGRAVDTKEFKNFVIDKAKHDGFFFGLYEALPHIYKENRVFVVEGPVDYLAFKKVYPNAVASMTAGLSEAQHDYLSLFCDTIIICFDSDEPGQRGNERVRETYKNILTMDMGNYKDPAKCLEVMGLPAFKNYVRKRVPFF